MNLCGHNTNMNANRLLLLAGLLLSVTTLVQAAQSGIMRDTADLRAAPYRDAKLISRVPKQTKVGIIRRRGGWLKVEVGDHGQGWVRLNQVRVGSSPEQKKSSFLGLSTLWRSMTTGRSSSTGLVATTGIRGISAEDLKGAKPDPAALASLDAFTTSGSDASHHAANGGLVPQKIKYSEHKYKKKKKNKKKKG